MHFLKTPLAAALVLLAAQALPAAAASSAASSASDSVSTSVGSVSDSIRKSSDSSSRTTNVAAGDYRIVEVTALVERPGLLRMTLQPLRPSDEVAGDGAFNLYLPAQALARTPLAAGQVVTARTRPYGTEFIAAHTQASFFLVMADDWYRELPANPLAI